MTDIYPAEGQDVGEVIRELTALGLHDGRDFRMHFTWDARPFIQASDDAYATWAAKHGKADEDSEADEDENADEDDEAEDESGDSDGETEGGSTENSGSAGRTRRAGKRR